MITVRDLVDAAAERRPVADDPRRRQPRGRRGRGGRGHRTVGERQVDAAWLAGRSRHAERGLDHGGRRGGDAPGRGRPGALPAPHDRLRVPVVPPDPDADRARERGGSAGAREYRPAAAGRPAPARRGRPRRAGPITIRRSSRAASSSAWRSRARWRWRRRCCWPTSRRGTWIRPREATSSTLLLALNRQRGSTLVLVTHDAALAARAGRAIALRDGRLVNGHQPR